MGIKWNDSKNGFLVQANGRHPKTRQPKSLRRYTNDNGLPIKTEAEARRIEKQLIAQLLESFQKDVTPTWMKMCERTFQVMRENGITAKTVLNYELCLRAHTYEIWGKRRIDTIQTNDIRELVLRRLESKSESHKKNMLKFLRAVFRQAITEGAVSRCPVPDLRIGRLKHKIQLVLTAPQLARFLNLAKEIQNEWYEIWTMAVYTGMRSGELFALPWSNVNLERRQILVNSSWNNVDGFKDTKSGDDRIVEIAPPLLTILKELKIKNSDSAFVLPRLKKWEKGEQAREIRMFLMGMGLPPIRFHDLRASWATVMLSKGIEPIKVMKMGGWKDLKTMEIYCRKAGVDIAGITDGLMLHNPSREAAQVIQFDRSSES